MTVRPSVDQRFEEVAAIDGVLLDRPAWLTHDLDPDTGLEVWRDAVRNAPEGWSAVLLGAEPSIVGALADPPGELISVRATLDARLVQRFSRPVVDSLRGQIAAIRSVWIADPDAGSIGGGIPHDEPVRCLLIRCPPSELPLRIGLFGEFADDETGLPSAREAGAVLEDWRIRHGATLAHVGRGTLLLHVEHPPTRTDQLPELIAAVFSFCPDLVFGDGDARFAGLRAMLAGTAWGFSWD